MLVKRPASGARAHPEATTFTRNLRYEAASEEGRRIIGSYAIAIALGVVWLLLVNLLPPAPPAISLMRPEETAPIAVQFDDTPPAPAAEAPAAPAPAPRPAAARPGPVRQPRGGGRTNTAAIGDAFGGPAPQAGGLVGDVSNVLRGVDVKSAPGGAPAAGGGGKAVIAYGEGGQGSRTPGRGGFGTGLGTGGGGAGNVGGVAGGGGVGRATVRVTAPTVVRAERIGGPGRDVSELGSFVRGRQSQLRFCYEEYGLKANPNLAGTVTVSVTLTGDGAVTGVAIASRSWSGAGAAETESCIRSRISGWRFPPSPQGGGTYSFPFNFTR